MIFDKKFFTAAIIFAVCIFGNFARIAQAGNFPTSRMMHKLEVNSVDVGGNLIFSDSPEYVRRDGILYSDTVTGPARVLFYHLNDTASNKKIAVIAENVSGGSANILISRAAVSEPGQDFLQVGKSTQIAYMNGSVKKFLKLKRGERQLLQKDVSEKILQPGDLIYGIYDFKTSAPVKISVLMYPPYFNPLEFIDRAEFLPKDEIQLRGTFQNMNRVLTLKNVYDGRRDGIGYILIGDDVNDLYKKGKDVSDGSQTTNAGNYGINYTLHFRMTSKTKFYLSPLGGYYAGAMRYKYRGKIGVIPTPNRKFYFGDLTKEEPEHVRKAREEGIAILTDNDELTELGTFSGNVSFEYSPPGASNLPVCIILMPAED